MCMKWTSRAAHPGQPCRRRAGGSDAGPATATDMPATFVLSGGMPCNTIRDMKIYEFIWPEDRVAHIAQHGVRPEEVEEVCFGRALVQRTKSAGANPVYYVLGQTAAGRYLFCVVIEFPDVSFFESGSTSLTRDGQKILSHFATRYVPYAGTHMLNILGFTDERPLKSRRSGARDNLELSALRAVAAQRHLQHAGIPLDRMRLGGHGVKRVPTQISDEGAKSARLAMARRVVLVIEPEGMP